EAVGAGGGRGMNRVSYHQNVFDLLEVELPVSTVAVQMIERCERRCGRRLPASLREWYSFARTVRLHSGVGMPEGENEPETLWSWFSHGGQPVPLQRVLEQLAVWIPDSDSEYPELMSLEENPDEQVYYCIPYEEGDDPCVWCIDDGQN